MLTEVDGEIDLYTRKLNFGQRTKSSMCLVQIDVVFSVVSLLQ